MSLRMMNFCKSVECPSSLELLNFQKNENLPDANQIISRHLAVCEFCAAELEFYWRFPQIEDEKIVRAEIPRPLFELASALLGNKHKDFSLLDQLLCQNEGVKI